MVSIVIMLFIIEFVLHILTAFMLKMYLYYILLFILHENRFERCHISIESCLIITYAFVWRFSFEQTMHESSIVNGQIVSSETITDRFSFCREVCTIGLDKEYIAEGLLGGPEKIVEIDECKIGRRKFEKGRLREGSWILGEIELCTYKYCR